MHTDTHTHTHKHTHTHFTYTQTQTHMHTHTHGPDKTNTFWGLDFAEQSEMCACMPKDAGSSPSGGSESTFGSD
jgi:hypothetical protein